MDRVPLSGVQQRMPLEEQIDKAAAQPEVLPLLRRCAMARLRGDDGLHFAEPTGRQVRDKVDALAMRGYRTLGVARRNGETGPRQFLGLLPPYDPPREEAAATIAQTRRMGVNVTMVTGDDQTTVRDDCCRVGAWQQHPARQTRLLRRLARRPIRVRWKSTMVSPGHSPSTNLPSSAPCRSAGISLG